MAGIQSIVYASRDLTLEETVNLDKLLNEGKGSSDDNPAFEKALIELLTKQPVNVLGAFGVQNPLHFRNRVVFDDILANGVKPWVLSSNSFNELELNLNSI